MINKLIAIQGISPISTEPKFYNLDDFDLDGDYIPGMININFDYEIKRDYPSKNISSITLKTWYRIYSLNSLKFVFLEIHTPFDLADTHKNLSEDDCKYLLQRHKEDFEKRVRVRNIQFPNGEQFALNQITFHDLDETAATFHQRLSLNIK